MIVRFAVFLALVPPAAALGAADAEFGASVRTVLSAAGDARYELVERRVGQTLDLLKDLRDYAGQVKDDSEKLRDEMLENRYEDWVNTRLLPVLFEARSVRETVRKTYELEKANLDAALDAAKAGDYGPVEQAIARVQAFQKIHEAAVQAVDAKIAAVRAAYESHFGSAKAALAQFNALALIQELLQAKPRLVKKIKLEPASVRPLQWSVVLEKERKDSNDPRFGGIPKTVSVLEDSQTLNYPVVVR